MKDIGKRIREHKLIISKQTKEKPIIIQEQKHNRIANEFMCKNQFTHITQESIKQHQTTIKEVIKQCQEHIPKQPACKYYNIKPQTPSLRTLVKLLRSQYP
jgi:gas vesicle protein